jgi:hypothetical protein
MYLYLILVSRVPFTVNYNVRLLLSRELVVLLIPVSRIPFTVSYIVIYSVYPLTHACGSQEYRSR